MSKKFQAIRGMNDQLPSELLAWQQVEAVLLSMAANYGYDEIRFPVVESTELFKRSIGDVTDIVEKEMYTFLDRNGDSLTLRPEGTACCVRAGIEHGLLYNQTQRFWYLGPMFRHERPQKGRYRQFYHFGVEAFGFSGPDIEAEMLLLSARLWKQLGIESSVSLEINSLGSVSAREHYREKLVEYFNQHRDTLDEDSLRRLESNPLRILDSKNPALRECIAAAPSLLDYLDPESAEHFSKLQQLLDAAGVAYTINPRLVRGLDYYNRTVFEWVSNQLGAQATVCAGGRYDGLVERLGGKATPAAGFALGLERLVELYQQTQHAQALASQCDIYMIIVGEQAATQGMVLAEKIRDQLPSLRIINHCGAGNFKRQFKQADKSGARVALILGDDEVATQTLSVKLLREEHEQTRLSQDEITIFLKNHFN